MRVICSRCAYTISRNPFSFFSMSLAVFVFLSLHILVLSFAIHLFFARIFNFVVVSAPRALSLFLSFFPSHAIFISFLRIQFTSKSVSGIFLSFRLLYILYNHPIPFFLPYHALLHYIAIFQELILIIVIVISFTLSRILQFAFIAHSHYKYRLGKCWPRDIDSK